MNPEIKAAWLADLRSGKHEQCRGFLQRDGIRQEFAYCCLGRLAAVQGINLNLERHALMSCTLPGNDRSGLDLVQRNELAGMNDCGKTFQEIADYIEENL